jgi:hypothetical protein
MHEGLRESYDTGLDRRCLRRGLRSPAGGGGARDWWWARTACRPAPRPLVNRGTTASRSSTSAPSRPARAEIVELGRACVHAEHRNLTVLSLLWKGIAAYARERSARYLIGCSSLTSQDPGTGPPCSGSWPRTMAPEPAWQTVPQPVYACPLTETGRSAAANPQAAGRLPVDRRAHLRATRRSTASSRPSIS